LKRFVEFLSFRTPLPVERAQGKNGGALAEVREQLSELQSDWRSGAGKARDDEALSALSGRVSEQAQGLSRLQESVAELGQALAGVAAAQVRSGGTRSGTAV
jgi:hypothetical protein